MTVTAFLGEEIIAAGTAGEVTRLIENLYPMDTGAIQAFDDRTGRVIDLPFWAEEDQSAGLDFPISCEAVDIRLLPRHWHWLNGQPRGANATLKRLVEAAMIEPATADAGSDAAYRFMAALCGDRINYEEALRALYRHDLARFRELVAGWPEDITAYALQLATAERTPVSFGSPQ